MNSFRTYLGRVRDVRTSYGTYHYALLEPLLESDEDGTEWIGPVQDLSTAFPTRGRVYWHGVQPSLSHGSLWQFEIEERPADGRTGAGLDVWQVVEPHPAVEIVDVRAW